MRPVDLITTAVREQIARQGLYAFVRRFWHLVEPQEFVPNWHLERICLALEAVSLRKIRRLVINVPPGTGKSLLTCVFWPAWVWTWAPEHKWLFTSYDLKLVRRDAERTARIVLSPLYQRCWPRTQFTKRALAFGELHTTAGGLRLAVQLGGGITGWHADTLVCDDPIKPTDALQLTSTRLEDVSTLWKSTAATRRANPEHHAVVLIMQRLNEDDLAGEELRSGAEHVCFPMRYVPQCSWDFGCSLGGLDVRSSPGELLFPARFPAEAVTELERALETPQNIAAQLQQNPVPAVGSFFEDAWFRTWVELPRSWELRWVQSWDLGFDPKTQASSRVSGTLWAWSLGVYYLVDEVCGWWNYAETKRRFYAQQQQWSRAECVLLEAKANGPALISELTEDLPQLIVRPIIPEGTKEVRARRHSAMVEAGRVWLPPAHVMPTVGEWRAEHVRFPHQRQNDRVDTSTQAWDYMRAEDLGSRWSALGEP